MSNYKARICLATPSNAAVDELAKRIIRFNKKCEHNKLDVIKLVRIGNSDSINSEVRPFHLEALVERHGRTDAQKNVPDSVRKELTYVIKRIDSLNKNIKDPKTSKAQQSVDKSELDDLWKQRQNLEAEGGHRLTARQRYRSQCAVLDNAHVVCGTLSSLGHETVQQILLRKEKHRHRDQTFSVLIIDEATQAIEMDCLIPLQFKVNKLVLVGDHQQLPATVISQKACELRLDRSLFERLHTWFKVLCQDEADCEPPLMTLREQYRMHPDILKLPNFYFYQNKLATAQCIENRPFFLKPYLVFDIEEGVETQGHIDSHKSYSNPVEASCIAKLCEIVLNVYAATCGGTRESYQSRIGVICPYSDQKRRIIDNLRKSKIQEVVVNTVDSFQGQEKDVIIMSCVRAQSNPTSIGFVENKKRMNVALTRAKFAMYVVGNFVETLKQVVRLSHACALCHQ